MENLNRKLKILEKQVLKKFPNLNWGGCGIFAVLLGEKLDSLNIEYNFVFSGIRLSKNGRLIKYYNSHHFFDKNTCISAEHVFLKVGNYFVNKAERFADLCTHIKSKFNYVLQYCIENAYEHNEFCDGWTNIEDYKFEIINLINKYIK